MIDILLRVASVVIFCLLFHQIYLSKGGGYRHETFGKVAMGVGILLVIFVAIRGSREDTLSPLYILHLILGGLFFLALFATGVLGWKTRLNRELVFYHHVAAVTTMILLLLTVVVGVISLISH